MTSHSLHFCSLTALIILVAAGTSRASACSCLFTGSSMCRMRFRKTVIKENLSVCIYTQNQRTKAARSAGPLSRTLSRVSQISVSLQQMTSIASRLTNHVTKEHLSEIFSVYGRITAIEPSASEKLSSGYSYQQMIVEYEVPSDAAKAVKYMNGGMIDAHEIIVQPLHSVLTDTTNRKHRKS